MRATVFFALVALCLAEKVEQETCGSTDCSASCGKVSFETDTCINPDDMSTTSSKVVCTDDKATLMTFQAKDCAGTPNNITFTAGECREMGLGISTRITCPASSLSFSMHMMLVLVFMVFAF